MPADTHDSGMAGRPIKAGVRVRPGQRPDATQRLRGVLNSRGRDDLIKAIDDPSPEVARAAIGRLVELEGQGAAPLLRGRLLDAEVSLVPDLARTLQRVSDAHAVDAAIAGLRAEGYTRRLAAAVALEVFAEPRSADALRHALTDEIAGVRAAALRALARLGAADLAPECTALLSDRDAQVRVAAIRAVAGLSSVPAPALASTAHDANCLVRLETARHLPRLPADAAADLLTDTDAQVRQVAAGAAGVEQIRLLGDLLRQDADAGVRRAAARALGNFSGEEVNAALLNGISDQEALVRAAVLHALERAAGRKEAVSRLAAELAAPDRRRRRAALYALSRLRAAEVGNEVWRLADDPDADVRMALLDTAAVLLADPAPLLTYMATDPDPAVRGSAETRRLSVGAVERS